MKRELECFTCGAPIRIGLLRQGRKFCSTTCNNNYKGLRDEQRQRERERDLKWPYGQTDDPVVQIVNAAIPRSLPEQIRSEACQELALAIVAGRCSPKSAKKRADEFIGRARKGYQYSSKQLSIELPMPGSPTQIPLKDQL